MAPKVRPFEATVKPPVDFAGSIIISDSASLAGTHIIKIGAFSVIHPRAKLVTTLGPITIGSECIINERATIAAPDAVGLTIHDGVVVETNAVIEARLLGEDSTIEVGAKVGKRAIIGKGCKLCPLTSVAEDGILPDSTIIYGHDVRRMDRSESKDARRKGLQIQMTALRGLIPSNPAKFM